MLFDIPVGPKRQFLDLWDYISLRDIFQQHTVFQILYLPVSLQRVCCWGKKGCMRRRLFFLQYLTIRVSSLTRKKSKNVLCWATSKHPRMHSYFVRRKKKSGEGRIVFYKMAYRQLLSTYILTQSCKFRHCSHSKMTWLREENNFYDLPGVVKLQSVRWYRRARYHAILSSAISNRSQ